MTPWGVTLRTRRLLRSAMYIVPSGATATSEGALRAAAVAWPPSPLKPAAPVPATVVMLPVRSVPSTPGVTRRIRLLLRSAM